MRIQSLPVIAALAISPLTAQATTIGFEDLSNTTSIVDYGYSLADDGFTFTNSSAGIDLANGQTSGYGAAAAGTYYMFNNYAAPMTITATNGDAFSFTDFFIEAFGATSSYRSPITVTGYLNGVQVGNTLSFTDTTSWQDIYANFPDVTSVVITGYYESLDNITVNDLTNVPEPATIAVFGTGLLCLGAIYRRRGRTSSAV